jgi:hypothetical protein
MKKLLGIAIAVLLFVPWTASAELLNNLKISGSLDVQMNSGRNINDFVTRPAPPAVNNDRIGNVFTRVLLDIDWDLLDDVHAKVTLRKNDRAWGTTGALGQGANGEQTAFAAGAASVAGNVYLNQAYVKVDKLFDRFDTKVGRQYWGDPGDLVVYAGPMDTYGLWVTAIDAISFESECDLMTFKGLAGTMPATHTGGLGAGQTNTHIRGFDIAWKGLPVKLNTGLWNRMIQSGGGLGTPTGGLNDNLYVLHVKLRGEAMGGWVSVDVAANSGQNRGVAAVNGIGTGGYGYGICISAGCAAADANYIGKALLLDFGYNLEVANVAGFTPWGNIGAGTGRSSAFENTNEHFNEIASDYRPGIINRRFNGFSALNLGNGMVANGPIGTVGLGNRVIYGIGVNVTPASVEKLTLSPQFWGYKFQRATIVGNTSTAMGNKHIGDEFGLTADWRHSENVRFGVGWAHFQPGGFVKESQRAGLAENNPAEYWFADLSIKF